MKTQKRIFKLVLLFLTISLGSVSCSKDDPAPPPITDTDSDGDGVINTEDGCPTEAGPASNGGCPESSESLTFDDVVRLGADFEPYPQSKTEQVLNEEPSQPEDYENENGNGEVVTERFVCTKRTVSIEDGTDDFQTFNPNASVIFPGNLLQGKTLDDATPEGIALKRAGGTISYNIIDGNLTSGFEVDEVKLSSIRDAQNNIIFGSISDGDYSAPANFNLLVEEVQSDEELALKLKVKLKTFATKTSGSFSVKNSSSVNTVMVKLTQQFYTMDFDVPTSVDGFFDESVTPERLAEYVQPDNPAAYISSVTYGRTFYLLFESTSSASEMKAKLSFGFKAVAASGGGSAEFESFSSLKNMTLRAIAYGGDADESLEAVGNFTDNNGIGEFVAKLGGSSDIRTGLPLSYVVNSVARPSQIVGVKLATEFDVVNCELAGVLPPQTYLPLVDLFKDDADGGGIGAMANVSKSNILVFNTMGDKYAWFNGNSGEVKGVYGIKDTDSPLGVVPLDNVGAGVGGYSRLRLFDKTGLSFSQLEFDPGNPEIQSNGSAPINFGSFKTEGSPDDSGIYLVNSGDYGETWVLNGGNPFAQDGFEAALRVLGEEFGGQHIFGKPGDKYASFIAALSYGWGEVRKPSEWVYNSANSIPFDRVGAACLIEFGSGVGRYYLFVNKDGNELASGQLTINPGQNLPTAYFDAPWVIN